MDVQQQPEVVVTPENETDREPRSSAGKQRLTIQDLGWTLEEAAEARAELSAFAADWDDPAMDVYDEL